MKTVKLPQGTLSIDANEFLIIDDKKNENHDYDEDK